VRWCSGTGVMGHTATQQWARAATGSTRLDWLRLDCSCLFEGGDFKWYSRKSSASRNPFRTDGGRSFHVHAVSRPSGTVEVGELSYHWMEVVASSASETGREGETQWAPIRDMVEP